MPCGHHFGHRYGYAPSPGYSCPRCGFYHPAGYCPGGYPGWSQRGFGFGPPVGWGPPPWAPPRYGPEAPSMSDEDIRKAIDSCLRADPRISPESRIVVEVNKGVVTLTGSVPDKWVKQAANEIIFALPGVVDVDNRLEVARKAERRSQSGSAQ